MQNLKETSYASSNQPSEAMRYPHIFTVFHITHSNLKNMSIVFVALLADSLGHAARTPVIPTVAVAPGVDLPMITMGGVHQEGYPDVVRVQFAVVRGTSISLSSLSLSVCLCLSLSL